MLVDAGEGPLEGVTLEGVSVAGEGEQLGVIAQRASVTPAGWDDGVARSGVTAP